MPTGAAWGAAIGDPDLVVMVGGDGSVAGAVRLLGGRDLPVALLPTGTANNPAKALGVAGDVRDVVGSWRDGTSVTLDVWAAVTPHGRHPFVEGVGGGLLATAIAHGWELEAPTFILGSEVDRALHLIRDAAARETERTSVDRWGGPLR